MRVPAFDSLLQDLATKLQTTRQLRQQVCYFPVHDLLVAHHLAAHYAADNWPVAVCRTPRGELPVCLYLLPQLHDEPEIISYEFAFPWDEKPIYRSPAWLAGVSPLARENVETLPPPVLQICGGTGSADVNNREQIAENVIVASSPLEVAIINLQTEISIARREQQVLLVSPCSDTVMAIHLARTLANDPELELVAVTTLGWGHGGERLYVIVEPQGETFTADFNHGERLIYASPAWQKKSRARPESVPQFDPKAENRRMALTCIT